MDWEEYKKSKNKRKKLPKWVFAIILLAITLFSLGYNAYVALIGG